MLNEDILKLCVRVNGIEFSIQHQNHTFVANPDLSKKGNYDVNGGCIAFVAQDGGYYVSPFVSELIPALEAAGYTQSTIIQPFSNGAVPLNPSVQTTMYMLKEQKSKIEEEKARNRQTEEIVRESRIR